MDSGRGLSLYYYNDIFIIFIINIIYYHHNHHEIQGKNHWNLDYQVDQRSMTKIEAIVYHSKNMSFWILVKYIEKNMIKLTFAHHKYTSTLSWIWQKSAPNLCHLVSSTSCFSSAKFCHKTRQQLNVQLVYFEIVPRNEITPTSQALNCMTKQGSERV